jgi:hypothetical protein
MIDLPLTAPDGLASLGTGLAGFGAGFGACFDAFADLAFAAAGLETLDFAAFGLADFAFGFGLLTFPSSNESSNR